VTWGVSLPGKMLSSGDDVIDDVAVDIGQAKVPPGVTVGQTFVVQPQQVQDRRVEVVNVYGIFFDVIADVVRSAVDDSAFHSASGQPS